MDADGQPGRTRKAELGDEKLPLDGTDLRVLLPVIVEPDLADRDDLGVLCPCEELRPLPIRQYACVLGMDADGGIEGRIRLRICNCLCRCRHCIAHADDLPHPRRLCARDHRRAVLIIALVIEMGMGVNERHHTISMRGNSCSAVPTA